MTIRVVPPAEGQSWDLGSRITCKVTSESTSGEYTVLEVLLETGQGSPLHVHRRETETIYVAEGECVVGDGGQDWTVEAGSLIVFEKDTPHFFRNDGEAGTKLIITAVPGGLDRYFEEVSAALQAEKPEEIETINRKYEIDFLG
ncbi:MAG: cupin domain-containing protein [Anaerolineales bacterium]|nr:cupin domain-containing protein [Anaerolineales bacterium]